MEKLKKIIKHVFSTTDKIENMSCFEILLDGIVSGFIIAIAINLAKILLWILGLIVLLVVLGIFF